MNKKRLIVVDISSFIFRAYHAIRMLNSPDGTPVNAVSGVLSMLLKLLSQYTPSHVLIARDAGRDTFRKDMYPEYKANRSETPEDLIPQFLLIDELVDKLKLPSIRIQKYEADDVIGSSVTQWKEEFDEIFIASSDKDLMQFVDEKIKMLDTSKDIIYGPQQVFDKMGVWPNQIVDYLSMLGDTSDNIPGMRGIGAKGAAKLLGEYKTLEGCIENKDLLKGKKVIEAFSDHLESGLLSKTLIQIPTDLDLGVTAKEMLYTFSADDSLFELLARLGFRSAITRIKNLAKIDHQAVVQAEETSAPFVMEAPAAIEKTELKNTMITSESVNSFMAKIESEKKAAAYFHFSSDEVVDKHLVTISFTFDGEEINTLPFGMTPFSGTENLSPENLSRFLELTVKREEFQLITTDSKSVYRLSPEFSGEMYDLTQAHFVADPGGKHELENIALSYLGFELPKWDKKSSPSDFTAGELFEYFSPRAHLTYVAAEELTERLGNHGLESVLFEMDLPLLKVLAKMEQNGIMLNPPYLKKLEHELAEEVAKIEGEVGAFASEPINLRSPKQVGAFLFDELGLPALKKTKTGYSTNSEVLEELVATTESEVPAMILRYREIDKILSTYVRALPALVSESSKRVHTSFNAHVAATGRLSSTNPNLQNIPVRSVEGKKVRKGFIAQRGKILLTADYSQVELRLLAHFSEDPTMVKAFNAGEDIHAQTASEVMGISLDKVTDGDRRVAKAVNFGLMYGQSSFGLAKSLGISRGEAKEYITNYFQKFSMVKSYLDILRERCEETGYAETMYGRKRFLPNINSTNRTIKSFAEREAINSPIQGTAADIIKFAMISIDKIMTENQMKSKMLLQVHDELIFEVVEEELAQMKNLVRTEMESVVKLSVPLTVDMGIGVNWFDLK
ncbi:MAG: DNA polymerase I [Bacteriovoracaceae bacterium]|nr:DNA polymerase I [Bacteriovoracaceae bacterium]